MYLLSTWVGDERQHTSWRPTPRQCHFQGLLQRVCETKFFQQYGYESTLFHLLLTCHKPDRRGTDSLTPASPDCGSVLSLDG